MTNRTLLKCLRYITFIEFYLFYLLFISTCFVETIVNLRLLGLVLFPMMYSALDHVMETRAIKIFNIIIIIILIKPVMNKTLPTAFEVYHHVD